MAVTAYCTENDLKDRLSEAGVQLRTDDMPPSTLGSVISRASSKINQYCLLHYTAANLAASDWVKETAATLAAYFLCTRRGNPAPMSVAQEYEMALEDLRAIRVGSLKVPDAAERKEGAPVMSNVRPYMRPFPRTVVEPARSTGEVSEYTQNKDPLDGYTRHLLDYVI